MADDIVDLDMLRCSLCCKYPNKRKCFSCSVADEIERLRAECDDLQVLLRGRTAEFLTEIERLRAAGDALAAAYTDAIFEEDGHPEMDKDLTAWKEARRG